MNLRSVLKEYCRPFYCIWYGKRKNTWKKTRYSSSILMGLLCSWLMCKCMFASIIISKKYENSILLITISVIASGYVLTDTMKCLILMIFVSVLGKSGRSYMRALCFAFVIAGPIENLSTNTGEILRVFSCSKILAINLTRTRFDLMTKPFQKTLVHMKEDIKDVQNAFNELKDVTNVLHEEVMFDDIAHNMTSDQNFQYRYYNTGSYVSNQYNFKRTVNPEFIETRYKNKFRLRCRSQLEKGKARCRKAFSNALEKCYEKMPFIIRTLICWPFKVDFICKINILGNPEKICDPSYAVPEHFGETYVELVATENKLDADSSSVKVNYTILSPDEIPGVKLGLVLFSIMTCVKYHKMYKVDLEYDNIYVTDYFKHLDRRIKSLGKQSLLPFKKYESKKLIDPDHSWQRTQEESQAVTFNLLQFSLEILSGCFFLFLDYVIVSVLLIIRNNSEMSFVQEGEHTIQFQIQGSGLIARLLRKTMGNFNMHETVSTYLTNEACLPSPTCLPRSFYLKLSGLYTIVLVLIYQSSRFLRMRRKICGYFYRKHEKKRILYLYNCLLKQRRTLRETLIREAKYNFANRQIRLRANLFLVLRLNWPRYFNWLIKFHIGRRKCVICGELEDSKFVFCRNAACKVSYCNDCFDDIGNTCWICNDILSVEIILNFNDFFEQFSFV
ncbi:protein sneaky isoform X2 [Lucilia cuprina]|uniref:protein sneaky isoform X2 n=1 Tax=Lucilia cuprina TaxID=7375 RepID=UPI001F05597E|nr:protein sneaky isoform X2 [Lucilia cuprina]